MWRSVAKLRYVAYLVVIVAAAVQFGGSAAGTGARNEARARKGPYVRFFGMTAQRRRAWAEVTHKHVHSISIDVGLRCASGTSATSHLMFVDRGPHGLRFHGRRFKTSWTAGGLTARVDGGLDNRGGLLVHGTVSVSGRFGGSACRSGILRWAASSAPLVKLSS